MKNKESLIFCKETNNLYFIAGYISPKLSEINQKAEEFKTLLIYKEKKYTQQKLLKVEDTSICEYIG